ncbi:response regulator transcription factor [Rhodoplanes roseus]|uniref:DNA-binding response regulator n=1 Tax=Rhodoplanes roseus TaxID=29409 RepID=A0A327KWL1_9BRAD|nr:response regulator transcription factor [Rhodoplanes roseus]RAI43209.1 DNA-binding response regulator [Rhodoplanes roseus]
MIDTDSRTDDAIVYVVDDDDAMRDSLDWLLTPLGLAVRTFASADAFLADHDPDRIACLVTDVRMPGLSGLELHETLVRRGVAMPVIVITGHGDVPMAVRAMRTGALDFIEKPLNNQLLIERIHEALRLARSRRDGSRETDAIRTRLATLTAREREVAALVAAGKQNKAIAFDLGISLKTVEIHRHNAMEKMAATTGADLARMLTLVGGLGVNP